jgi:hypothetical protein
LCFGNIFADILSADHWLRHGDDLHRSWCVLG